MMSKKIMMVALLSMSAGSINADSAMTALSKLITAAQTHAQQNPMHVGCGVVGALVVYFIDDFLQDNYPVFKKIAYMASGATLAYTYGPAILSRNGFSGPKGIR